MDMLTYLLYLLLICNFFLLFYEIRIYTLVCYVEYNIRIVRMYILSILLLFNSVAELLSGLLDLFLIVLKS